MSDALLELRDLRVAFSRRRGLFKPPLVTRAVDGVSLSVPRGTVFGLVGESGCGKTTISRAILGLVPVTSGGILFDGVDYAGQDTAGLRPLRRRVQMVFQDPFASLNPRHTVGRIISDGPVAHGTPRKEALARAKELLELVGLSANAIDRYPHEFSGGQRQRVGIARALALEPDVLVADEAVSALDVSVQAQILKLIKDIQSRLGLAILFVTHDLRVAAQICDRIAVMQRGRIVETGPTAAIFADPQHAYTRQLLAAVPGGGRFGQ